LRHESIAAQLLAISGIIDVSHRIAWSDEREANCPHYELVRALESVRPFPLHAVSSARRLGCVRRWADMAQFIKGLLITRAFFSNAS
jgi:hypothetical protein